MLFVFFCKQKTAYETRISDWSSDVCSSDLGAGRRRSARAHLPVPSARRAVRRTADAADPRRSLDLPRPPAVRRAHPRMAEDAAQRSEEHTSELQSLMRISYAVFCLQKTKDLHHNIQRTLQHQYILSQHVK